MIERGFLEDCLEKGLSTREIENIYGYPRNTVSYWINKYGINDKSKFVKSDKVSIGKIDTKEKAYFLGFLLADAYIGNNDLLTFGIQLADREILDFFASIFGGTILVNTKFDKKNKQYPSARWNRVVKGITTYTGGKLKEDRHYPIIRTDLERYLVQGFFDADGCITWGKRKDSNRIWHKICFKSKLKLLSGLQISLLKNADISSICKQSNKENCSILEFANRNSVLKFLNYIYPDDSFIILKRKYLKACALRLELEENGEGAIEQ